MKCILSGGTGFLGRRISALLRQHGHEVAVWSRGKAADSFPWDVLKAEPSQESLAGREVVIHLAGETVAQRWSADVKQRIRDTRVLGTRHLVDAIGRMKVKPKVLVSASAIGYYGARGDEILTEQSAPGAGFLCDVCREWELEARRAELFGVRVVRLRIGFVLGIEGGALGQMLPIFRLGLGGRLGDGEQWMPWIHADDVARLFVHSAESDLSGVWNAASPYPVRNAEFTRDLGAALHRPAILPVPGFALSLAFGEFGQHMLDSARVVPEAALDSGYPFRFPELKAALTDLLA